MHSRHFQHLYHDGDALTVGAVEFFTCNFDAQRSSLSKGGTQLGPYPVTFKQAAIMAEACATRRVTVHHEGKRWSVSVSALESLSK